MRFPPVSPDKLADHCARALMHCGVRAADARVTAEALVNADARGVHSHGTIRMIGYVDCLMSGGVKATAKPVVVLDAPGHALVDAAQGLGIPVSVFATELAIEKAQNTGIAMVNVRNSHHHGACGYYTLKMADAGLMGMAMSTGDVIMAAAGSASRDIGNNPFSYALPAGKYGAICYDVAMSMVAAGKISIAIDEHKSIPLGWLLDTNGEPTSDPTRYDAGGALVPFGGHKGYGLAVMVEAFAGLLSGAAMLNDIHAWNRDPAGSGNVGHMFLAIAPGRISPDVDLSARAETMARQLARGRPAPGTERILYPGQLEREAEVRSMAEGINLPDATIIALKKVSERTGQAFDPATLTMEHSMEKNT